MRHYQSEHTDRWIGFDHRPDDIVVSTRSKCGTTWMQMICCLLVHQRPDLPAPLGELAPWLDWSVEPLDVVRTRLAAQSHRRVIKTHVPLDGLPLDPHVTYIVVARHPLDVAVSFFHHLENLDRVRMAELKGERPATEEPASPPTDLLHWLDTWIDDRTDPALALDTLPGNFHHLNDAWARRDEPNVVLVHYEALQRDLGQQMRALACRLGIDVPPGVWPSLVDAAGFDEMKARSDVTTPDHVGVFKDRRSFFRSGASGEGVAACSADQLDRYRHRAAELADPDALVWLDRGGAR